MIQEDFVGSDYKDVKEFRECWDGIFNDDYGFLTIDLTKIACNGK